MPAQTSETEATAIAAVAQKIVALVRAEGERLADSGLDRDFAYRLVDERRSRRCGERPSLCG